MRAVVEIDAAIAGLQAMRVQLLAGIGAVAVDDAVEERLDPGVGLRDVACELALQQRRSDRTVESELGQAMGQTRAWPATLRAWGAARIHRGHVAVIVEIGAPLQDPVARAAYEAALLPHAEQTTPGRLRAIARRELERHLPAPLAARHEVARARRGVFLRDLDDGMSMLQAIVPTVLAHGIHDRLTQIAKATSRTAFGTTTSTGTTSTGTTSAGTGADAAGDGAGAGAVGEVRTFDQLRADAFADLLLTADPTGFAIDGITAEVSIVMPSHILTETPRGDAGSGDSSGKAGASQADVGTPSGVRSTEVARLTNGAPVDPETARLLAARATAWNRLLTDPLTAVDAYAPSTHLRRLLRARDQHCRWPGCTQQATRSDIDHTIPWAEGGKTEIGNLAHLCRRHHTLKGTHLSNARRWKVHQHTPGILTFTSPTGRTYTDEPPAVGPVFTEREPEVWGVTDPTTIGATLPF